MFNEPRGKKLSASIAGMRKAAVLGRPLSPTDVGTRVVDRSSNVNVVYTLSMA